MINRRPQREFAAPRRDTLSFTHPTIKPNHDPNIFDKAINPVKFNDHKSSTFSQKTSRSYNTQGGDSLYRLLAIQEDYSDPDPTTLQALAITTYQKEIMELIKHVPESEYELSLKDIVELRERSGQETEKAAKKAMVRSESMDARVFLLKMFLPFSLGAKRRKSTGHVGSKVSPKPISPEREKRNIDGEWLSKKEHGNKRSRKVTRWCSILLPCRRKQMPRGYEESSVRKIVSY